MLMGTSTCSYCSIRSQLINPYMVKFKLRLGGCDLTNIFDMCLGFSFSRRRASSVVGELNSIYFLIHQITNTVNVENILIFSA